MRLRALQVSNSDLDTANVLQVVGLVFLFFPFFFFRFRFSIWVPGDCQYTQILHTESQVKLESIMETDSTMDMTLRKCCPKDLSYYLRTNSVVVAYGVLRNKVNLPSHSSTP